MSDDQVEDLLQKLIVLDWVQATMAKREKNGSISLIVVFQD
jgi:hypothetical protein